MMNNMNIKILKRFYYVMEIKFLDLKVLKKTELQIVVQFIFIKMMNS